MVLLAGSLTFVLSTLVLSAALTRWLTTSALDVIGPEVQLTRDAGSGPTSHTGGVLAHLGATGRREA